MNRKAIRGDALIPEGWQKVALGEFMEFKNGINADKSAYGQGTKFVNVMDVFRKSFLKKDDITGKIQISEKQLSEYSVIHGDILFNRTSETREEIAYSTVYTDKETVTFGGFVIRGRQKKNLLLPAFAGYCFKNESTCKEMIRRSQGAVRANIGQKDLIKIPILIPPKHEQEKIVQILSRFDSAIEKTGALIAAKQKRFEWLLKTLIADNCSDGLPKDISACLQDKWESAEMIEKNKKEEYRINFHYRFIHELRNYIQHHIQHKDLPTHSMTTGGKFTKNKHIECFSDFFITKTNLSEEGFKTEILNQMEEAVNLILAIRHYIEAVSQIHIQARGLIETKVTEARRCIESAVNQYKEAGTENNSVTGLYAINRNEQDVEIEKFALPVLLDMDDIRCHLKEKNGNQLTNLHRRYATTQTDREN